MNEKQVKPSANIIGIVFPVYYGTLPVIVKEFAGKLEGIEGKYIFAVSNYGGAAGDSLRALRRIIEFRGGELKGSYGIHMPQNSFRKFWENQEKTLARSEQKLDAIAENAKAGRRGKFFWSWLFSALLEPLNLLVQLLTRRSLSQLTGAPRESALDEMIRMIGNSYSVGDECTECGICAEVCPVDNIKMVESRPVWLDHCENCLACYNFCPHKAIRGGVAEEDYHYRHPDVTANTMMEARRKGSPSSFKSVNNRDEKKNQ